MEQQELRPALEEVVLAYGTASVLAWGILSGVVLLLQLPEGYAFPSLQVAALVPSAYFVVRSAQALWLRLTVRYYIGDGLVRRKGGWFSAYSAQMALSSVKKTDVEMPLLFRAFGVGHMWVIGDDCSAFMFRNLKDPEHVEEKIHLTKSLEPLLADRIG